LFVCIFSILAPVKNNMSNPSANRSTFIEQAEAIILKHLSNEQFGVSELADAMNMSRSNLLRKIKKQTQHSASQFIRQVRLKESLELLKEGTLTVSEVSYQVGFGSTSYFIKCFRELYGYSPGEVGKGIVELEIEKVQAGFL
jgi:AraC-like DNA-binding protein